MAEVARHAEEHGYAKRQHRTPGSRWLVDKVGLVDSFDGRVGVIVCSNRPFSRYEQGSLQSTQAVLARHDQVVHMSCLWSKCIHTVSTWSNVCETGAPKANTLAFVMQDYASAPAAIPIVCLSTHTPPAPQLSPSDPAMHPWVMHPSRR